MEYLLLIVAVIIVLVMVGLYLMWLRKWYFRLLAVAGWILFLWGFVAVVAIDRGIYDGNQNVWLVPLVVGGGLAAVVHILNNRLVNRMMSEGSEASAE